MKRGRGLRLHVGYLWVQAADSEWSLSRKRTRSYVWWHPNRECAEYNSWVQRSVEWSYVPMRKVCSIKNGCESRMCKGLQADHRILKTMTVMIALTCILLTGCKEDPTVWSSTSRSPDGSWLAVAHTVQHTGFGTDGVETIVEIKRTAALRSSSRVLAFDNDGASMALKMNWVTPSHLEVLFKGDQSTLYFQVVRTSGIEISVRDLSTPESPAR